MDKMKILSRTKIQCSNHLNTRHPNTGFIWILVQISNGAIQEWQYRNTRMVIAKPSHSNTRPFANQTTFENLITRLVQYSDNYCIWNFLTFPHFSPPAEKEKICIFEGAINLVALGNAPKRLEPAWSLFRTLPDYLNTELKVCYISHDLNNEILPGIWLSNK